MPLDTEKLDEIILIFDSYENSPYTRRHPPFRAVTKLQMSVDSIVSNSSCKMETPCVPAASPFPIELEVSSSMQLQNLRYRKKPQRAINKSGVLNTNLLHLPQRSRRYIRDLVTTIIDAQWRFVVSIHLIALFSCWIIFAVFWYLIALSHGDVKFDIDGGIQLNDEPNPCVIGASSVAGFLLFSIELQTTIGFGERLPAAECPEAVFLMMLQIVTGVIIEGSLIGIIYMKMTRPARKPMELKFSQKAVICQQDSKLCLMFRICDPNELHTIESKVRLYLLEKRVSAEGEILNDYLRPLSLENGDAFIIFPLIICHIIDNESPLYDLSAKDLLEKRFELIATFSGASASTGYISEERTSYISKDLLWGHRFINMVHYDAENKTYVIDYDEFDATEHVDTPLCSAKRLHEVVEELHSYYYIDTVVRTESENNESYSGPRSNDSAKSPTSLTTDDLEATKTLMREVRFRLSHISLEPQNEHDV